MGAKINIAYDSDIVNDEDLSVLSQALPSIVSEAMSAGDVFLYVDTIGASIGADPIEIFIQINAAKVNNPNELLESISEKIKNWKAENNFIHPVNVNIIPVEWHSKIAI